MNKRQHRDKILLASVFLLLISCSTVRSRSGKEKVIDTKGITQPIGIIRIR